MMHHAQRFHTVIDTEGNEHSFTSIAGFARDNGLGVSSLSKLVNGNHITCGAFKLKGEPNKLERVKYHLKSPEGYLVIVSNTRKLGQQHKINRRKLDLVCNGELQSVDGWTKADDDFQGELSINTSAALKEKLLKIALFA